MAGRLTARKVATAKPGKHSDGGNLYLIVADTGSRKWVLRVQADGRRHDFGLGAVAQVSLVEARDAAATIRKHKLSHNECNAPKAWSRTSPPASGTATRAPSPLPSNSMFR